jgi:ketosteroid isomerase-like protein
LEDVAMSVDGGTDQPLAVVRRYLRAIEHRDDPQVIAELLHPDLIQEEFPNRLNPQGGRSDRATMLERLGRGRQLLTAERYEIDHAVVAGERVALEVRWSGTLAVALGESLPSGATMRARFALFFLIRDGQILEQRNYDCFEPW